jgi:two-component system, response regulator
MINSMHDVDVLLIEDNPDDARLVIRELKRNNMGNNLIHLPDGAEALDFIFVRGKFSGREIGDKPKLILLDLKMPKVDGLQVLRAIKEDPRTKFIPVVVMTSSQEEKDIVESYSLGVNAYVVKPVEFDAFSKAVTQLGLFWILVNQVPK